MKKLWTVLTMLVILSLALGTIACGGGAAEPTGGEKSLPTSVSATDAGGGSADQGSSGGTCCWREVGTLPPTMPTGQIDDWGGLIVDAIGSQHMDVSYTQCPLRVDFSNSKSWMDYQFQGQIIVNEQTGFIPRQCEPGDQGQQSCSGGDILGSFTFKLQLVDLHRGKVVKEGQISWVGESTNRVIGERKLFGIGTGFDQIKELSASFKPLPEIIHKYEGLPEKATLEPEKDLEKDPVQAGEKVTIHLKDIVDYRGYESQPWQWVVVKAEKGQIVGGRDQGDGTHAFEVGGGAIDFIYQAPDECKKDTENNDTITVYNSCDNDLNTTDKIYPKNVIATKSFDIDCTGWLLEFTYTASCPAGYATSDNPNFTEELRETETYSITVKALLKATKLEQYMVCPYTATAYECWTAQVKMEGHNSRERKWHFPPHDDCPAKNLVHSEGWAMQYEGDLPVHLVLMSWPDPVSSAKNARQYLIGFYGKPGEPDNLDYGVPVPVSYTATDVCDQPNTDNNCANILCGECSSDGTMGISDGLYFLPATAFASYALTYGTPSLLGEGGDSRSVTWNDYGSLVFGPAIAINNTALEDTTALESGETCLLEMSLVAFEPGQDFYTNHLEWTLTKVGE